MAGFNLKLLDNKLLIALIVGIVVIVVLLGVLIGVLVGESCKPQIPPAQNNNQGGGIGFDPSAGDYVAGDQGEVTSAPGVAIPGWGKLTMPPNTKEITVDFFNPEKNAGYYHLTFELRLIDPTNPDGYEVLYKSGLVEAGKHIQKITLSRGLEEGTYAGILFVQPYKLDGTPTNNLKSGIEIVVQ